MSREIDVTALNNVENTSTKITQTTQDQCQTIGATDKTFDFNQRKAMLCMRRGNALFWS